MLSRTQSGVDDRYAALQQTQRKQHIHMAMIWEAHATSVSCNINIINVAFVLSLITTCSLAPITKSCFFAVGVPVEARHKTKMRWKQEKPSKN